MKRKFIFFTMFLLTLIGGVRLNVLNAQETVEIGDGTLSSYYSPVAEYGYVSLSQIIYLKEEIKSLEEENELKLQYLKKLKEKSTKTIIP